MIDNDGIRRQGLAQRMPIRSLTNNEDSILESILSAEFLVTESRGNYMSCPSREGGNRQMWILDFVVCVEEQKFNKKAQFLWPMKIKKTSAGNRQRRD